MPRLLVMLLLVSTACRSSGTPAVAPAPTTPARSDLVRTAVSGPIQLATRAGDVAEFQPAVPAIDTGGRCQPGPEHPMLQPGQRALPYTFGPRGRPTRNVMLIVDSAGRPVRYSDLRGDLRGHPDPVIAATLAIGARTSITLNLSAQTGVLRNSGAGTDSVGVRVRGPGLLDAANLGTPAAMIARILRECAG